MYNNFNTFGMFGIGNLFGGVCNTYTNYYGTGFGGCGCGSIFDYKSMAGLAVGTTLAPILGVLTYKGVSSIVQNKKDNSVDTLDSQIREQLNILGITDGDESRAKDITKPEQKYADAVINAETELKAKQEDTGKAGEAVEKIQKSLDAANPGTEEYGNLQTQLATAKTNLETAKTNEAIAQKAFDDAKLAEENRQKEITNAKSTLASLIEKRNEKLYDDADGCGLFRTSKDDLDNIIDSNKDKADSEKYAGAKKANLKAALHQYTKAVKANDKENIKKYRDVFVTMYKNNYSNKELSSDLTSAYKILSQQEA